MNDVGALSASPQAENISRIIGKNVLITQVEYIRILVFVFDF